MSTERHDHPSDDHPGDGHGPGQDRAPEPAAGHHLGRRERPARRSRLTVAVVAAAVLAAGGGGAYWAASSAGGDGDAKAAQPLRFDGPDGARSVADSAGTSPSGSDTYRLTGTLPQGPRTAPVYRTAGGTDRAAVQRLAALLGLTAPVRSVQGSWQVGGAADGGGPSLLVGKDAPGTWSYTRYGPPAGTGRVDSADSSSSSSSSSDTTGGAGPVSVRKAQAVAAPVLAGLGLAGARTDASQTAGSLRTVTADPVLGGLPTHGWTTTLQVGADGVLTMGYGRLSALTEGDSYPVVGAAAALKELNAQPVMHPDLCAVPLPRPQASTAPGAMGGGDDKGGKPGAGTATTGATLPDTRPCQPVAPHTVEVRGATFGLALQFVSGTQALVPAWLFDTAQAGDARTAVVAQTAVDPSYVTTGSGSGGSGPGANAPGGPSPVSPATPVDPGGPERVAPGGPAAPGAPHTVDLVGYKAAGRTLTLTFWGGVCPGYQASAQESGAQVRVRVTETPATAGKMCPMIMRQLTRTVTLAQPLGSRSVVDTFDGQPIRGQ